MKDKKLFQEYMTAVSELFDREISKTSIQIYWQTLSQYTDEQCKVAFDMAIRTLKFFPKPAELIELIPGEVVSVEDKALVMAHEIAAHLKAYGSGKFPDLHGDKIAHHLMTRRWPYREWGSQVLDSEMHWWVKEFSEAYRSYSETDLPLKIEAPDAVLKLAEGIGAIRKR